MKINQRKAIVFLSVLAMALVISPLYAFSAGIWSSSAVPQVADCGPDNAVEVGVKFTTDSGGTVSGIRFYKAAANTGPHVASLWSNNGERLATADFIDETGSGWQEVRFSSPVAISPGTVYIASYHASSGHYSCDENYFAGQGVDNPPLHAPANGISGVNGVYVYGSPGSFPTLGWNGTNYWVDVIFSDASLWSPDTVPEIADAGADNPVELGMKFNVDSDGSIKGIRFYKSDANSGPHVAHLWNSNGTLLATALSANETASGWQQADFSAPVAVTANTVYIASYHAPVGHYSYNLNFFTGTGVDNPPLHSPADGTSGANGVFAYGPAGTFPASGWNGANYWVDVAFDRINSETPQTGVEPTGWYAGDMHVHRSCGGPPETMDNFLPGMEPYNLSVISMLADMGNEEVKDATQDLPRVNGSDDPYSTAGRIMRWDAEWHWDANYTNYPHSALGGHVVALGLSEAHQVWTEYTYPIFNWAHQQNAIAGFGHMQYLNNEIPQTLNCCTPIEYPVEVAMGESDFISEDVMDVTSNYSFMCPDCAMQAYYRLLNCGFRPGLAAGTDYPCNDTESKPLGALLTYVATEGGELTYDAWIEGIARGRTVISRNGHNEFLDLRVSGTYSPGGEIRTAGPASIPVTVQWRAAQDLSGTIELVHNGNVVASRQATVAPGNPQTLSATVNVQQSGWVAARRMGPNGHYVHTGAVFVTVNDLPVRASVDDANFYVAWMDNLLEKTSPGGAWSSYFTTSRSEAQERYMTARSVYRQIAEEAGGVSRPTGTIFTSQTPTSYHNDQSYELGTRFSTDVGGQITQVRMYSGEAEKGNHTVRIWRAQDGAVVSGPYTWHFQAGFAGWKTFMLPQPLTVSANTEYIVSVSNSNDWNYAAQLHGLDNPMVNGHLRTVTGSGVWTDAMGSMPTNVWQNTNYFRDVVFEPQM